MRAKRSRAIFTAFFQRAEVPRRGAANCSWIFQELFDLAKSKSELLRLSDKSYALKVGGIVGSVPGRIPRRRRQKSFALIKAERLDGHFGQPRNFYYAHGESLSIANRNPFANAKREVKYRVFPGWSPAAQSSAKEPNSAPPVLALSGVAPPTPVDLQEHKTVFAHD
jgi:hypothetical protein